MKLERIDLLIIDNLSCCFHSSRDGAWLSHFPHDESYFHLCGDIQSFKVRHLRKRMLYSNAIHYCSKQNRLSMNALAECTLSTLTPCSSRQYCQLARCNSLQASDQHVWCHKSTNQTQSASKERIQDDRALALSAWVQQQTNAK